MRISDWSSDVCSSDLAGGRRGGRLAGVHPVDLGAAVFAAIADRNDFDTKAIDDEIGRASSRATVCQYVSISAVAVSLKKKAKSIVTSNIPHHSATIHHPLQYSNIHDENNYIHT